MKKAEYTTYLSNLAASDMVEFPTRKELIEFFSMMMGEIYRIYLNSSSTISPSEKALRLSGEPELITFVAKSKLEEIVPESNSPILFFKKKAKMKLKKMRVSTTAPNERFYDYLLQSLNQEDNIEEVFPTNMEFEMEGDTILRLTYC